MDIVLYEPEPFPSTSSGPDDPIPPPFLDDGVTGWLLAVGLWAEAARSRSGCPEAPGPWAGPDGGRRS